METIVRILKSEALAFLVASVWAYVLVGASWWLFFALFLVPDVFMVGYLKDSKVGAWVYNIGHTYSLPMLLGYSSWLWGVPALLPVSIIWVAHISMDRFLGYGLKLDTGFKDTHLGRIGR